MLKKVLVANRGEIALRVIRGCRELDIVPVAVFSEADRDAPHVRAADEAWCIGPAPSSESYLRGDRILNAAKEAGADAIHPGYGFLAENAAFARAVEEAGLVFVGPPASAMEVMGDKLTARRAMEAAGVPVVPGTTEPIAEDDEVFRIAEQIGLPVMIKASAGGGGKGMRRVNERSELASALRAARSEARSAFGDDRVYVEKYVENPRHVEVQVLSDSHGNHLHLFERDCSVQRRNQKLIEESPCPVILPETRAKMVEVATRAAAAVDYRGAGTVEFLFAPDQSFWFLEMNTRLQVEHPVTELVTGLDLVHLQLLVAAGEPIPFGQQDVTLRGHAMEVRICAEDPADGFRPAPGRIDRFQAPQGPGVRLDAALHSGYEVPIHYDPMVGKLIAWGPDRAAAIARLRRALRETTITGIRHNLPFFEVVLRHPPFLRGEADTGYIARYQDELGVTGLGDEDDERLAVIAAVLEAHRRDRSRATAAPSGGSEAGWKMAGRLRRLGRV